MLKFLKNQKGLTLVELLAVIVILGVLSAIAVPTIGGLVSDTKGKADSQSEALIQDAAERYAQLNLTSTDSPKTLTISTDLVANGYLKSAPMKQSVSPSVAYTTVTVTYSATSGAWTAGAPATTTP